MTVRYVQDDDIIDYTPNADTPAGTVVVQGDMVGVTKLDIKSGQLGAVAVEGIFDFPKATGAGSDIAAGAKLYWNATDSVATASANSGGQTPTNYPYIGKAVQAAAAGDATVRTRLCP